MKKIILVIFLVITGLVLLAQIDDDLSEQSTDLIGRLVPTAESESYLYLFGIFAKEDEDPTQVGKKMLAEYRQSISDNSEEFFGYPDADKLPLPTGEAFCRTWTEGCLAYLFSAELDAATLMADNKTLVARSNAFLEFDEYTTVSAPTLHEILPHYQYIVTAERIKTLQAVAAYRSGDAEQAVSSLLDQFSMSRKAMALQDTLVGKLVFLMQLSEIIDITSVILSKEDLGVEKIPTLSQFEKSFHLIAAREFGMSYHTFQALDKNPELFELGGNLPGWVARLLYKPNMTINAVAPGYHRLEKLAQMSPADFAHQMDGDEGYTPSTSKLRNYVGYVLISISPGLDQYVARFTDFEAKLALFNQTHHSRQKLGIMENPYYGNETPKEKNGRLCFSGPLEDRHYLRCLSVTI